MIGRAFVLPVLARLGIADAHAAGRQVHAEMTGAAYRFRTLDEAQRRSVAAIVDQIIPDTDTPGAVAARVHEFIDLILKEFAERADRERFLAGLADLESRCRTRHGRAFHECTPPEQLELLEEVQREAPRDSAAAHEPFIHQVRELTLWGYYTSEVGMAHERPYDPFPGTDSGCPSGPR